MRKLSINMPIPYEVQSLEQMFELIKSEKILVCGGWRCKAGFVVLGCEVVEEEV